MGGSFVNGVQRFSLPTSQDERSPILGKISAIISHCRCRSSTRTPLVPEPQRAELKYLVERQREELRTINEVGRLLSSASDPQAIIRLVASYLKQAFPIALCGVLLVEPRKLFLTSFTKIAQVDLETAIRTLCTTASEHARQPISESTLTRLIDDQAGGTGQWTQGAIGLLRSQHLATLTANKQVIGLLGVFSGKTEAFSDEDRHGLDIVSAQLGAGLRNAVLVDELRYANELKTSLLMVIAHELRIPLTSVKEGVTLILDNSLGPVNAEQKDFLSTVNENVDRLGELIEKVILTTQMLTGQFSCTLTPIDLSPLLTELEQRFRPIAQAKGIALEFSGTARTLTCPCDRPRLSQALSLLLENAIQATPAEGCVTLACTDTPAVMEIAIQDTGAGIPPEQLSTLFQQFLIVGDVNERKTGGLGLGLFMAKSVVDAHHGTIAIQSQVGHGTTATVQLPKSQMGG